MGRITLAHREPLFEKAVPDRSDPALVGSWLSPKSAGGADYSSAGTNLTPVVEPDWRANRGALYDGASTLIRNATANWRIADSTGTIEMWVSRTTTGAAAETIFASTDEAADNDKFLISITNNAFWITSKSSTGSHDEVLVNTSLTSGQWYYLVLVSTGSTYVLYIDGTARAIVVNTGTNSGQWLDAIPNRDCVEIGADTSNAGTADYLNAQVGPVNVYSEPKPANWVAHRWKAAIPDEDLVLSVRGDGQDRSRFERTATIGGTPILGMPYMQFDGTNDYLQYAAIDGIASGATTVFWFRSRVDGQYQLVGNTPHLNRRTVVAVYAGGELRAGYWQGAVYRSASGAGAVAGVWHHVVAAFDGDETMMLVLDGVQLTGTTDPGSGNGVWFAIGQSTAGSDRFDGQITDVRYYLGVKSLAWAQRDYATTRLWVP